MKKNLTALAIAAMKPEAKAFYVGDAKQDGLRLRVAPDGKLTWNVTVRIRNGSILSTSLGRCDVEGKSGLDLAGARERAAAIVKSARQGSNLIASEAAVRADAARTMRVSDLIDRYFADITNPNRKGGALRTAKEIRSRLLRTLKGAEELPASAMTKRYISDLLDPIFVEFPREAEKRRQNLDALFRWAVAKGFVDANPATGMPPYGNGTPRDRALKSEEIKLFLIWLDDGADNMPEDIIKALRVQLLTGARIGEVVGMTASEIFSSGDQLHWTLPATRSKNKKQHTRALIGRARSIIEDIMSDGRTRLFMTLDRSRSLTASDVGHALNHRTRPIPHFTTHDLRRTFVSALDELNIPLETIAAAIGHRRGGTETRTLIRHYSRPNLDSRIESALAVWDNHLNDLLAVRRHHPRPSERD